jgi:hypothetical protein
MFNGIVGKMFATAWICATARATLIVISDAETFATDDFILKFFLKLISYATLCVNKYVASIRVVTSAVASRVGWNSSAG